MDVVLTIVTAYAAVVGLLILSIGDDTNEFERVAGPILVYRRRSIRITWRLH